MEQLQSAPQTPAQRLQKQRVIEDFLGEVMTIPRSDILRAIVLSDRVYISSKTRYAADIPENFQEESWFRDAVKSTAPVFIPIHVETQGRSSLSVFSVAQRILSTKNASDVLGVIRVDSNYLGIKTVCDRAEVSQGNALFILDSAGNQIYANSLLEGGTRVRDALSVLDGLPGEGSFFRKIGGAEYIFTIKTLRAADWRVIDVHSTRELTRDAAAARDKAIFWALLCAAGSVLVSVLLVKRFLKPIYEITELMQKVQTGDLSVRAVVSGKDELAYLAGSFNEMTGQLSASMEKNNLLTGRCTRQNTSKRGAVRGAVQPDQAPLPVQRAEHHQPTDQMRAPGGGLRCVDHLSVLLRGMVNTGREIPSARK
jgi:two-component system sensor histidine kinase YesM